MDESTLPRLLVAKARHYGSRKVALRDSPPICVREYTECPLYQLEKRREDGLISRYTD